MRLLIPVASWSFARHARLGADPATDLYGAELLAAGLPLATLLAWAGDPTVVVNGAQGSLFDAMEDLSAPACTAKAVAVFKEQAQTTEAPIEPLAAVAAASAAVEAEVSADVSTAVEAVVDAEVSAEVSAAVAAVVEPEISAEVSAAVAAAVAVSGEFETEVAAAAAAVAAVSVEVEAVVEAEALLPSSPSGSGINAARALSVTTE